jgi:hypothetical protein
MRRAINAGAIKDCYFNKRSELDGSPVVLTSHLDKCSVAQARKAPPPTAGARRAGASARGASAQPSRHTANRRRGPLVPESRCPRGIN